MIIDCNNCNKKFNVDSDLIPKKGRLLQCSSCNHRWFFKKANTQASSAVKTEVENNRETADIVKYLNPFIDDQDDEIVSKYPQENKENVEIIENNQQNNVRDLKKISKKPIILNIILIFIISFTALIILIDTFKYPISKIVPNLEFILYNLYESIKDIKLFFIDLI